LKLSPNACESVFTNSVLANPGTPTNNAWPPERCRAKSGLQPHLDPQWFLFLSLIRFVLN
jgi:hypothetical protein